MEEYSVYSEFNLEQHKKTYVNYLEVLITADGEVLYAVPSHQEKAIQLACHKHKVNRTQLASMCPPDMYFDYLTWLLSMCDCISVWTHDYQAWDESLITSAQYARLRSLKLNGVYKGRLPKTHVKR